MSSIKQSGSALLTALFIMTLVAIVATAMSTRLQMDIYRTRLVINHDKLYLATQAVTFWCLDQLNKPEVRFPQLDAEHKVAQYPKRMETVYERTVLKGGLYDLQARFNLNNMADKKSVLPFVNLLSHVVHTIDATEQENIAFAVKNWLSTYDLSHGKDLFTSYYLSQKPPYYPSHLMMTSPSEFRLIKNVSPAIYHAMEAFISTLPEMTAVNINTAPKEVLMSLGNGLNEDQVNQLMNVREERDVDLVKINALLKKFDVPTEQITTLSQYYLGVAYARNEDFDLVVYTVFKRSKDKNNKLSVRIVSETINSL